MSETQEDAKYNAKTLLEHAEIVDDHIDGDDYDAAWLALDTLFTYASRLAQNLEDLMS